MNTGFMSIGNTTRMNVMGNTSPNMMSVEVRNLKPNKRIFYFAANPSKNPRRVIPHTEAYTGLRNSGTAISSDEGIAYIHIHCPQVYVNEDGNIYPRHFHFVYVDGKKGNIGNERMPRLHTRHVSCVAVSKPRGFVHVDADVHTSHTKTYIRKSVLNDVSETQPIAISGSQTNAERMKRALDALGYRNTIYIRA